MSDATSPGSASFTSVTLAPAGREFLACSAAYPADWQRLPMPPEEPDVQTDLPAFLPLLVSMAGYGAVLFTVGARPAYADGTVLDWARFLCEKNGLTLESATPTLVGHLPGVQCEATQPSDAGLMRVRAIFLEDGARLFNLGTMAPEQIWKSVETQLTTCLHTFRLADVKGPTVPLGPPDFKPASDPIEHPKPTHVEPKPDHLQGIVTDNPHTKANPAPTESASVKADRVVTAAEVALADNAAHLAEDHPVNANLRNRGIGLVPRVLDTVPAEKYSLLAPAAIEQTFRLPFGWHAIDDGKRTLAFDHENKIQINFNLRPGTTADIPALFHSILADLVGANGDFPYFEFAVAGFQAMGAKDLKIEGEVLQQCYLAKQSHRPDMLLVCRVTATADGINFALAAAGMMLISMKPPQVADSGTSFTTAPLQPARKPPSSAERRATVEAAAQPSVAQPKPRSSAERRAAAEAAAAKPKSPPDWWNRAVALEVQDKLAEAEQMIRSAIDHLGVYSQLAHLYELRGKRLAAEGRTAEARAALEKSCDWMDTMASQATSGGEGAALSLEANQHRARLGL